MSPLFLAALAWIGCKEAEVQAPNVVLLTLDTTRADRLGSYGYEKARTETLDALAASGRRFSRAYAPVPLTIPSHVTLFTGLEVHHHGVRSNSREMLESRFNTMAEILQAYGYHTGAATAAFVTQASWGFGQGFKEYLDEIPKEPTKKRSRWHEERRADLVVDDALSILERAPLEQPTFLWVHLFDPHAPYDAPEGYDGGPYDAELAFVDDQVQRLVDRLGDSPTLWVVAGDHGEGLGEHGQLFHGQYVYNDTQLVPLFFSGPGIAAEVVDQPVGLVDVLPTLLDALGFPIPEGLDGRVQPGNPHPIPLESHELRNQFGYAPHRGLVEGHWKLIATPRPELYDQRNDPDEVHDLAAEKPEVVSALLQTLEAMEIPELDTRGEGSIDPETVARLAALGYVASDHSVPGEALPDPKDRQDVLVLLQRSKAAEDNGRIDAAIALAEEAVALDPKLVLARSRLALLSMSKGDPLESVRWARSALELNPDVLGVAIAAIMAHNRAEQPKEAWALCEDLLEREPHSSHVAETCMTTLMGQRRRPEAEALGRAFLESHPEAVSVAARLGMLLATRARFLEAHEFLLAGLESPFPLRGLRQHLGMMRLAGGQLGEAMALFRQELVDFPDNDRARESLARLLDKEQRHDEQLEQLEILLSRHPESRRYQQARAEVLLEMGDLDGCQLALQAAMNAGGENDPDLLLVLANLQAARGDMELGKETFERASALKAAAQEGDKK
jgi:arylsulfatase A-like enzyme/tetratricopeptide (TPR) repeat protein